MSKRLLFLKLTDLLLFSLLVKSQAGVDQLEKNQGYGSLHRRNTCGCFFSIKKPIVVFPNHNKIPWFVLSFGFSKLPGYCMSFIKNQTTGR